MRADITINENIYSIDLESHVDISIPMNFNGLQPNAYNVGLAASKPYEIGNFIGDTRLGGSCNFEEYKLVAHCNGTHTECVGHISNARISIHETLKDTFIPAALITIGPVSSALANESYDPLLNPDDFLLTSESIRNAVSSVNKDFLKGLIIRTLPNDRNKLVRRYIDEPHPFFSLESMELISAMKIKHLLTDIPSIDRTFDGGKMNNHHKFWDVEQGSHDVDNVNHSFKTITEMIFVPDSIPDGCYFVNLQIAPFVADASSSRPLLFKIQ